MHTDTRIQTQRGYLNNYTVTIRKWKNKLFGSIANTCFSKQTPLELATAQN